MSVRVDGCGWGLGLGLKCNYIDRGVNVITSNGQDLGLGLKLGLEFRARGYGFRVMGLWG